MTTTLAGVRFPNPVFTASGCAAAGRELDQFFDVSQIGGVVTKSIMLAARSGRATPRMAETPSGMLNSIGLQGPGIDEFLRKDLAWLEKRGARAVVSIAGGSVEDYASLAQKLRGHPAVSMIEVNISCPNVEDRGQVFACDPAAAAAVVRAVRSHTPPTTPVLAKLSPDVTDITVIARACVDAGADGLSVINTLLGMVIDTDTLRPALAGVTGGLSGPAIRPVAVRCVYQVHAALPDVPILGMGGIRPAWTRCSSCWPAPVRSASARPSSVTRPRRCGCSRSSSRRSASGASTGWPTRSAWRTRRRSPSRAGAAPTGRRRAVVRRPARSRTAFEEQPCPIARPHRRRAGRPRRRDLPPAGRARSRPHVAVVKVGLELFCRYRAPSIVDSVRGAVRRRAASSTSSCTTSPQHRRGAVRSLWPGLKPRLPHVHAAAAADMVRAGRRRRRGHHHRRLTC
jgi:dihydroorotate dehydrogenase (NAD+) catalytic subunit